MTIHAITRHIAKGFMLVLLAVSLLPIAAYASSPAQLALETSISRILSSIKNPDYVNPATRRPLRQQIEDEVLHIFDFKEFSSRTVGPRWSTFSPAQQQQFSDAFAELDDAVTDLLPVNLVDPCGKAFGPIANIGRNQVSVNS